MRLGGVVRAHSVLMGCANLIEPALPTEICARPCSPYSHTGPHLTHPYGSLAVADPKPAQKKHLVPEYYQTRTNPTHTELLFRA